MSGINGIFSIKKINNIEHRIEKMNNAIIHRGPNRGNISAIDDMLAFGYRNLFTINRNDNKTQPITSNSGRWTILFGGELYDLDKLTHVIDSNQLGLSDAEIILEYIEKYGIEKFVETANGMYSICIYDNLKKKLYLIRDKMGIKPLYYTLTDVALVFSSEIKGILNSGLVDTRFNEDAIDEYLGNRYVRAPYTFFEGIFQLEAGSFIIIDEKLNVTKTIYWELPLEFNYDKYYNEDKITKNFKKWLIKSIEKRLTSDVPLGTYLSGGVDSSLITAITSKILNKRIDTFTIGFDDSNEFGYADMVAKQYNTRHHCMEMTSEDYFNLMEEVISFKDSPLGVPNEVPLAYMSKVLKESITIVLSGEGADELLGGYGRIFRSPFDFENHDCKEQEFYSYFINKYEYVPRDIRDKYLNTTKILRDIFDDAIKNEFLCNKNEENVFRFFHKYHVKGLLQRVDTTTMLAGVKARVPFLDEQLIEYSYRNIPYDLKLKWVNQKSRKEAISLTANDYSEVLDIPKYILKKIAYEFLPKEVIERRKMGFPVPLNKWLSLIIDNGKEILKDAYWLKSDLLNDLIIEAKKNIRAGQVIWMFINVELFRKMYFDKDWKW